MKKLKDILIEQGATLPPTINIGGISKEKNDMVYQTTIDRKIQDLSAAADQFKQKLEEWRKSNAGKYPVKAHAYYGTADADFGNFKSFLNKQIEEFKFDNSKLIDTLDAIVNPRK